MFQSLFGSLLNHLCRWGNENVSVRHLSLICIISILTTIYSLKNGSVYGRSCRIYNPKSFGLSRKEFHWDKKKNYVIFRLRVGLFSEKLLQRPCLRPRAAFLRPRYSFSLYGPPSRQTTYIDTMLSELGPKSVFSDVVRGKFSICGSPFHFSHSFPRH